MEILLKCVSVGIFSSMASLLIRRFNPELSFSVSAVTVAVVLLACTSLLRSGTDFIKSTQTMLGSSAMMVRPMLKCLGIAILSRIGTELCRDASQGALASAVEMAGGLCAAAVAMPVIISLLNLIGGML